MNKTINIPQDFSRMPLGRYVGQGPYTGESFRKNYLLPALDDANCDKVTIVLDGAGVYGSTFLEEAFGGLVRDGRSPQELSSKLEFVSKEDPSLVEEIEEYIQEAGSAVGNVAE